MDKRQFQKQNEAGFTLIETLIVLSIVAIMTAVGYANLTPTHERKKMNYFMEQFSTDILFAQQYAISRGGDVKIYFWDGYYDVRTTGFDQEIVLERRYDKGIKIAMATMKNPISFKKSGNVEQAGGLYLTYKERKFSLVFQIGRGRFSYHEL